MNCIARLPAVLILAGFSGLACGQLKVSQADSLVLTHILVPAGPVPTAADPDGVYPYVSYCETSARPEPVNYRFLRLENPYLEVLICPDLGGKVTSIIHRSSGKDVLYNPDVIRHTRILPRFNFVAGGIETSFPISHSPSQNEQVSYTIDESENRIYVTCGERELRFGMQWSVEYSLGPRDTFLTQRVRFHNPGRASYPWMSWSNAALPSLPDTEYHFPGGRVLRHSSVIDTVEWDTKVCLRESGIQEMTGYFWLNPDASAFGAYTPSNRSGLYHVARTAEVPGMKLWSYGAGHDSSWATLSTAKSQPYIEIQAGPAADQSIKLELHPGQSHTHTEFWIPVEFPADIYSLKIPEITLRSEKDIPMFQWTGRKEIIPWLNLLKVFSLNDSLPDPPDPTGYCWPPSGMEELGDAFKWVIGQLKNRNHQGIDLWVFYYGAWLAGRGEFDKAVSILSGSGLGLSKALLARLLRINGKTEEAVEAYRQISESWLTLHPQVVVERDRALRMLGPGTIEERASWLNRVNALTDEWVIERRVQLLIDMGRAREARELLLSTDFQKIHQTYNRTELWFQICRELNEPFLPVPVGLGEDRLFRFGAYREFE